MWKLQINSCKCESSAPEGRTGRGGGVAEDEMSGEVWGSREGGQGSGWGCLPHGVVAEDQMSGGGGVGREGRQRRGWGVSAPAGQAWWGREAVAAEQKVGCCPRAGGQGEVKGLGLCRCQ